MPKWKKGHTTPHVCLPITNPRRNIPSEHDQQARYRLQQSVLDSFHTEIQGPVFLSLGPEAKLDMFNNFVYIQQKTRHKVNHQQMAEGNPKKAKSPTKQLTVTLLMKSK